MASGSRHFARLVPLVAVLALGAAAWRHGAARSAPHAASAAKTVASAASASSALDPKLLALADVEGASVTERRLRALEERVRAHPDAEPAWLLLGQAWVRRAREASDPGYYLHANACAEVILARSPTSVAAQNLRGLVLLNQHAFRDAKALAETIVAREPRDPTAWGTLSDAALELGDFDTAVSAVERMLEQKPGLPAYSRTSYLRFLHGDEAGAVHTIRLAIDAGDPSDPEPLAWVLVQAASLFFQRGDYDGADAGFQQALELVRDYPPALVGRARVLLAHGDAKPALPLLERAFAASPLVETGALLVQALALAGDAAAAERAYAAAEREGLRGDPRSLSVMDSTLGRQPKRALALARAEHVARGDVYTEDALAWALYRNGELTSARQSIERARRLGTRDARLLYHHGAILIASGQQSTGVALVRQALARNPAFEPAAAAEARRLLGEGT